MIIVCEGSTTEYNYFCEIRDYMMNNVACPAYSYVHIIPGDTDPVTATSGRPLRKMEPDISPWRYYAMCEDNEEDYQYYHSQPVRYVREAELFLEKLCYDEAWAVYDWDEKPGQCQKKHTAVIPILQRNQGKLFVAFSSYSFEEWILAHFEHNITKFSDSDCSDTSGHSYLCGSDNANPLNDCHGTRCIAGYLRLCRYVPQYSKTDKHLFSTYTLDAGKVNRKALFNASWLRFKGKRFSSDAYTDVDVLVCKMLSDDYRCEWFSLGSTFELNGTSLKIVENGDCLEMINEGDKSCLLTPSSFMTVNADGAKAHSLLEHNSLLSPGCSYSVEKSKLDSLLKLSSINKDCFVEID